MEKFSSKGFWSILKALENSKQCLKVSAQDDTIGIILLYVLILHLLMVDVMKPFFQKNITEDSIHMQNTLEFCLLI